MLTDAGTVFSFGCGLHGRLGHGNQSDQLLPKAIAHLRQDCLWLTTTITTTYYYYYFYYYYYYYYSI